jgi:methyl-accepting chemotaxis protein
MSAIRTAVGRISDVNSQIDAAAAQQNQAAREIDDNVISIAELSNEASSQAEIVLQTVEGVVSTRQQIEQIIKHIRKDSVRGDV